MEATGYLSPSQIVVSDKDVPADAMLGIYNNVGKIKRRLTDEESRKFNSFYSALIGEKYRVPDRLPVRGMVVAAWRFNHWHPAIVVHDRYIGTKSGRPLCQVHLTDVDQTVADLNVADSVRLLSRKLLDMLPLTLVEDKSVDRIVRRKRQGSSDEETVDYSSLIPYDNIVSFEYKFPDEPLLQPMLDRRRQAQGPVGNVADVGSVKLMVTSATAPDDFIFTVQRHSDAKIDLQKKLREIYSPRETDEYLVPSELAVEKLPVIALMPGIIWARAYVLENIDKDICVIAPVDGEGPQQIYKRNLRFVHRSIADIPKYGYRGKLAGILPRHRGWSEDAKRAFMELVGYPRNCYIAGIVSHFKMDGTAVMYLWNKGKQGEDVWVGDELVRRLLAKEDNTPVDQLPMRALPQHNEQAALLAECTAALVLTSGESQTKNKNAVKNDQKIAAATHDHYSFSSPIYQ